MKKKRVLITGGTGLLGTHLILSQPENVELFATVHDYRTVIDKNVEYLDLEMTNSSSIKSTIEFVKPDVIFHTAAHGRVDFCEANPDEAEKLNYEGTARIVDFANKYKSRVIFCSTNMIFDGLEAPYTEKSKTNPQTVYGKSKVKAEEYIRNHAEQYTIFRLMTMFGWNWQPERKNMVSMAIEKLKAKQELWMTNDVFNNMLSVIEAAKVFWEVSLTSKGINNSFLLAGSECLNRYDTTLGLCSVFNLDKDLVHEVSSDYFKGLEVPRSPNTCFDTSHAQEVLDFTPLTLKEGLEGMRKALSIRKTIQAKIL